MGRVKVQQALLGQLAVRARFITEDQLEECLRAQEKLRKRGEPRVPKIGAILRKKGYLKSEQVDALLSGRFSEQKGRFGEIAIRLGFLEARHVEYAVAKQEKYRKKAGKVPLLGKILVQKGYLRENLLGPVLAAQGKRLAECTGCGKSFTLEGKDRSRETCKKCGGDLAEPRNAKVGLDSEVGPEEPLAEPAIDVSPGDRLGGYVVESSLGRDASGILFRAVDESSGQTVALKILDPARFKDRRFKERFLARAERSTHLAHTAIKRLLAVGKSKGHHYVAMEWVEARSLREILAEKEKLEQGEALRIATYVADALRHAVKRGVRQPDLRPANVLLDAKGKVKVASVGLPMNVNADFKFFTADKRTMSFYAAPETVEGEDETDERAEVFTVGCLLYEMLCGRPVLAGKTPAQALTKFVEAGIRPLQKLEPDLPKSVHKIVAKMLEIEPEDRTPGLKAVKAELQRLALKYGKDEAAIREELATITLEEDGPEEPQTVKVSSAFKKAMEEAHERAAAEEAEEAKSTRRTRHATGAISREELSNRLARAAGAEAIRGERASLHMRHAVFAALGLLAVAGGIGGAVYLSSSKEAHEARQAALLEARERDLEWVECGACKGAGASMVACPECQGQGRAPCLAGEVLLRCAGGGIEARASEADPWVDTGEECVLCKDSPAPGTRTCPGCDGKGVRRESCAACVGRGRVQQ